MPLKATTGEDWSDLVREGPQGIVVGSSCVPARILAVKIEGVGDLIMAESRAKEETSEAFADRFSTILTHGFVALAVSLGVETGIFDALVHLKDQESTAQEIANAAGLKERYVQEWLGCMSVARLVDINPATEKYLLPEHRAPFFTRGTDAHNLALFSDAMPMLSGVYSKLAECLKKDGPSGEPQIDYSSFKLSSPGGELKPRYDVVVVGSGYGGSVAACRASRASKSVCVLERGKEWLPGDFPETTLKSLREIQLTAGGHQQLIGNFTSLYDFIVGHDVTVLQGSGLGGTSLINANVALDADPRVFEDEVWPKALRDDLDNINGQDRSRFLKMMRPSSYPDDFPSLTKLDVMREAVQDGVDVFSKPPLYVNFNDMPQNQVGVPQPACVGCGNCCSGCNTGAKSTLNLTYLQDAKAHGAEFYTKMLVHSVIRDKDTDEWVIHITANYLSKETTNTIRAGVVLLGAGALGSTNILLNSAAAGLSVSSKLGQRFSTNGDTINFAYNGERYTNSVGKRPKDVDPVHAAEPKNPGPGPCIAGVIDMRRKEIDLGRGYVLEDGTPPSCVKLMYRLLLIVGHFTAGIDTTPQEDYWRKLWRIVTGRAFHNSLAFLSMSQDNSRGRLVLDEKSGRVIVDYPDVGKEDYFQIVMDGAKEECRGMKAELIPNPFWRGVIPYFRHVQGSITVHPLGGCGMGESGDSGVVNHMGQVFVGDTAENHTGLFVVDGAVMPRCIGVNPSMTIGILAERTMRLLAQENNWTTSP
ncbi:cholesterol oxidase-like [Diadema antillarum]|uniref:cholesterol oxidase-like n=1 Tax=Diadema antillarum TaxID=105358 RepID=UPI003A86101D